MRDDDGHDDEGISWPSYVLFLPFIDIDVDIDVDITIHHPKKRKKKKNIK